MSSAICLANLGSQHAPRNLLNLALQLAYQPQLLPLLILEGLPGTDTPSASSLIILALRSSFLPLHRFFIFHRSSSNLWQSHHVARLSHFLPKYHPNALNMLGKGGLCHE